MPTRIYFSVLLVSGILFLALFLILSFHNRLAADDFYYMYCVPGHGIYHCMQDLYNGYSGRWSAYLLTGFIISFYNNPYFLFFFNIITITVLIFLLYKIILIILERITVRILPRNLILTYAVLLVSGLFFCSFNKGETWFWIVQVCTYLWSIIMGLFIIYFLLKLKFNYLYLFFIALAASYIGGASESYAIIFLFLFMSLYISTIIFPFLKKIQGEKLKLKLLVCLLFLTFSFIITLAAPGNETRISALPSLPLNEKLLIPFKSYIRLWLFKIFPLLSYFLIFSIPWIILGKCFSDEGAGSFSFKILMKHHGLYFLAFIFICILTTSFIMSEIGPDRALSIVSFSIIFFLSALFYYLGFTQQMAKISLSIVKIISAAGLILISLFHLATQNRIAAAYSNAYDYRITLLLDLKIKDTAEIVYIPLLPPSGFLYSAEISSDTNHFTNRFLSRAYNLNFKPSIKEHE